MVYRDTRKRREPPLAFRHHREFRKMLELALIRSGYEEMSDLLREAVEFWLVERGHFTREQIPAFGGRRAAREGDS